MDYELCKKLKDLGFPQEDFGYTGRHHHKQGDVCYKPTLSELIEACGEQDKKYDANFFLVFAYKDAWYAGYESGSNDPFTPYQVSGKTPEESVANLWIEINKDAVKE